MRLFVSVLAAAMEHAADKPDLDMAVYRGAIPAMLRPLDPHSVFFDREQFEQLRELERSVTKGFGTIVSILPGRVIILQTMPGSPSQKAGPVPGDEIVCDQQHPALPSSTSSSCFSCCPMPGSARRSFWCGGPARRSQSR